MLLEMTRECDFDEMLECLIVHMSADDWNGKWGIACRVVPNASDWEIPSI
jgi:hypothetical protein